MWCHYIASCRVACVSSCVLRLALYVVSNVASSYFALCRDPVKFLPPRRGNHWQKWLYRTNMKTLGAVMAGINEHADANRTVMIAVKVT